MYNLFIVISTNMSELVSSTKCCIGTALVHIVSVRTLLQNANKIMIINEGGKTNILT